MNYHVATMGRGYVVVMMTVLSTLPALSVERTVIDCERGGMFPSSIYRSWDDVADLGCIVRSQGWGYFDDMHTDALKVAHGRLQHFETETSPNYSKFPMQLLREYEADEVAQQREPLIVTATYSGTKRLLYYSLHYREDQLKSAAVNIGDERFVKFFIHQYVRDIMHVVDGKRPPNMWTGLDNCSFRYSDYGVDDGSGNLVTGLTWDRPFPQSRQEWNNAAKYIFKRIKELAPDIKLMPNEASQPDYRTFPDVFKDVDGFMTENVDLSSSSVPFHRNKWYWYRYRTDAQWPVLAGKPKMYRIRYASDMQSFRTGYMAYLVTRDRNSFFGARDGDNGEWAPADYAAMRNDLGLPVEPPTNRKYGSGYEYRLYRRECEGGIVWYNLSNATRTVDLSEGGPYYDRGGNQVTSLAIDDLTGDYVRYNRAHRAARPRIHPRRDEKVARPFKVTIDSPPHTGSATIRYTLDGTDPDGSSPVYTAPVSLPAGTAVVKARAFQEGMLESFVNTATYEVTDDKPRVSFHLAQDHASEFLPVYYVLAGLSHYAGETVQAAYSVTGGTAGGNGTDYTLTPGTLTLAPGERYRYFPVAVTNDTITESPETIEITLSEPVNAVIGAAGTFSFTIQDNDGGDPVETIRTPRHLVSAPSAPKVKIYDLSGRRVASDIHPSRVSQGKPMQVFVVRDTKRSATFKLLSIH